MRIGGLGMYPDESCYDPDRPSWLPYFIDDLTESDCKYGASNVLQATANAAGDAAGTVAGAAANTVASAATNAASAAFGGMDLSTVLLIGAAVFLVYTLKK